MTLSLHRIHLPFLALLTFTTAAFAQPVSLFDGKTLDGWNFDPKIWRVKDGMLTGGWN